MHHTALVRDGTSKEALIMNIIVCMVRSSAIGTTVKYFRGRVEDLDGTNDFAFSLGAMVSFNETAGGFLEFVRVIPDGHDSENLLETGLTFLLNDDFQFDVWTEFGLGMEEDHEVFAFGTGLIYRLFANKH